MTSSAERPPDLVPEFLAGTRIAGRLSLYFREPFEQAPLLRSQIGRRPHADADMQIATTALAQPRESFAAHAIHRSGLGSRRHLQRGFAARGRHFEVRPERRLRKRDRESKRLNL